MNSDPLDPRLLERERQQFGDYTVGVCKAVPRAELGGLLAALSQPIDTNSLDVPTSLEGRGKIRTVINPTLGPLIIKTYCRGGVLGKVVRDSYLRGSLGLLRSEAEFVMLEHVRSLGVCAPEPILWAAKGWPLYRAWLVTREIANHQTLAEVALVDAPRAHALFEPLLVQVDLLIEHGVFHLDLHPGNVVVDDKDNVYLLDFDKARVVRCGIQTLRDRYLRRWRRAVIKHQLPEFLAALMCLGLRRHLAL